MTANLISYGIDYEKGLRNCMGMESIYRKILTMFLQDTCFSKAKKAYGDGNQKELFCLIHEMKGVSGNAALIDLYKATIPLVELLRHGTADPAEVDRQFAAVEKAYNSACTGIHVLLAG